MWHSNLGLWPFDARPSGTGRCSVQCSGYYYGTMTWCDVTWRHCCVVAAAVSVRWVTLFPLGSLVLLLFADVIAIVGHWTSTRVLNFLSGILSVIGGMIHTRQLHGHNIRPHPEPVSFPVVIISVPTAFPQLWKYYITFFLQRKLHNNKITIRIISNNNQNKWQITNYGNVIMNRRKITIPISYNYFICPQHCRKADLLVLISGNTVMFIPITAVLPLYPLSCSPLIHTQARCRLCSWYENR